MMDYRWVRLILKIRAFKKSDLFISDFYQTNLKLMFGYNYKKSFYF